MGTLLYKDLLADYTKLDDVFMSVRGYTATDAEALPKLSGLMRAASALLKELDINVHWRTVCGAPIPTDEMTKLRSDIEVLIEGIGSAISRRASVIREHLRVAGL